MHAKYNVSICNGSKVMANVKVVLKQTDKQTNKQTGQKQYAPQILSGGHKKNSRLRDSNPGPLDYSTCLLPVGHE